MTHDRDIINELLYNNPIKHKQKGVLFARKTVIIG